VLESERLLLRHWRDADVGPWVAMCADPRVMEFLPPYREGQAEAVAARARERLAENGYGWWALEVKGVAPFAGVISLQMVPFEAAFTPALEVGWRLAYEHWGQGYATEGAALALRFAFDVLERDDVVAITTARNVRSQRVMQRLGMTRDPKDDFDHPRLPEGHPLRPHVLYRISS
jgi:ribosomal-protein-alanine N-acetyltransferase